MNTKVKNGLLAIVATTLMACPSPFFVVNNLQAPSPPVSVTENENFNLYLARGTAPEADWTIKNQPDPQVAQFIEKFNDLAFPTSTGYRFKAVSAGQTSVVFELVQNDETLEKTFTITVKKGND